MCVDNNRFYNNTTLWHYSFPVLEKNSNEMPVDAIPGEKVETEIIQNFDLEWK